MERWIQALQPYQKFDPAGWVSLYRMLPSWGAGLAIVAGVLMLLFGGGRLFRLVAGPMGAVVALLWTPLLAHRFGLNATDQQVRTGSMVVLSLMGFAYPPALTFFAFGVPAGLFSGSLVGENDWLMGFLPAFIAVGAVAVAAQRVVGAIASSLFGAWLLMLGILGVLQATASAIADTVARQPLGVVIAAGFFAIAGAVFQLFVRASPEERTRLKVERVAAQRKRKEQEALEKRWASYSKDKGLDDP